MIKRALGLALTISLGACGGGGSAATDTGATEPGPVLPTLADQVQIDQVAVYQAVKTTLFDEAAPVANPNAPVIAGRPGLVRIHARTIERAKRPAPLSGELRVKVPGKDDFVFDPIIRKLAPLVDGDVDSTFTFELPGEAFAVGTKLVFTLKDPALPGDAGVTLPGGELAVDVKDSGTTLKVKIVPVRYGADGSKRTPPLAEKNLSFYRDSLYKLYPVAKVDMTVRETIDWPLTVAPDGDGWDNLLDQIIRLRRADNVPDDVYYAAVFTPADNAATYCQKGCILGVAPAQFRSEVGLRVAMIVGFGARSEGGTLAQEIAHAMGRYHANCGRPQNIDEDYPYDGGRIGTWGWDAITKDLVDPDDRWFDFMSYCSPVWVSDYTFKGLWQAADDVARTKRPDPAPQAPPAEDTSGSGSSGGATAPSFLVDARGGLRRGEDIVLAGTGADAREQETTVVFEDAHGKPVGTAPARYRATAGLPSGRLVLEPGVTLPSGAVRVRSSDLATALSRATKARTSLGLRR